NTSAFPAGRAEHSAVYIANNKKLYILGGMDSNGNASSNQLFYIDVSEAFTISIPSIKWVDLSSTAGITNRSSATACEDSNTIFYIGGVYRGGLVSRFDTLSRTWSEPVTSGSIPTE
ncbi:9023_t:CDS:1, partial [Racocetra fulgida]